MSAVPAPSGGVDLSANRPLDGSITNSFAMDRDAAYIVTTKWMYRIKLGPDGAPQVVWREGYQNIGIIKPGQLSAGSGTTPTVLDNGKYVAILDNANQAHVVVYRTDERLDPGENRIVCEVPVFKEGEGADDNSLMGSGRSLIVFNDYGWDLSIAMYEHRSPPSKPGIARIDIDPNGKGCNNSQPVWENDGVTVMDEGMKVHQNRADLRRHPEVGHRRLRESRSERVLPVRHRLPYGRSGVGVPDGHRLEFRRLLGAVSRTERNGLHTAIWRDDRSQRHLLFSVLASRLA